MAPMASPRTGPKAALEQFALSLPGAFADMPWEDDFVAKVGKKIFVFFGPDDHAAISVKLPESADHALATPGAAPTSYGLGRHGWVTVPVGRPEAPDDLLRDWIEESYRAIATKRLVAELDRRSS
jgi:predicted DNA-binding protein (MmcQ/YjbR family)